jgi:tRNA(Ile)-lysidine synthase
VARRPPAVARVLERVTATIREHDMLQRGDLILVEVSGGPDSVCLLHAMWHLRRLFKTRLAVFHFDHGLREGSAADAAYVRRLAGRLGLPFHLRSAEDSPPSGASVEFWARNVRLSAAGDVRTEIGATRVADGHTRDDQAENMLMALILGWGLNGMGGIPPVNGVLVRPLLDVTREEVESFCRSLGLRPRHDPTNDDTRLLRNAIRLEAIPSIERATGRKIRDTFARTAGLIREDAATLWEQASDLAAGVVEANTDHEGEHTFAISARAITELPRPMASRVVRRAFQLADLPWNEPAIDAVLDLADGRPGRSRDLQLGLRITRDRGYVRGSGPSLERFVADRKKARPEGDSQ